MCYNCIEDDCMYCVNCGNKFKKEKFCPKCGKNVKEPMPVYDNSKSKRLVLLLL